MSNVIMKISLCHQILFLHIVHLAGNMDPLVYIYPDALTVLVIFTTNLSIYSNQQI